MIAPSIADVKALQRERRMGDRHVVYIGRASFVVAHTDEERAAAAGDGAALDECPLHDWLESLDGPPCEPGYYTAERHEPDAYSEPYGADPWEFYPLPDETDEFDGAGCCPEEDGYLRAKAREREARERREDPDA